MKLNKDGKLKNVAILGIVLMVLCFMYLPAFAEEMPSEAEKETIYITEDTTLWDVVESTNPDAEEIPDEIKENFKKQLIQNSNNTSASFVAINNKLIDMIILAVTVVTIGVIIFVKSKKR